MADPSLMVCVWPLGVPVLYTLLLVSRRRLINPVAESDAEALVKREEHSERISHLEFLYQLYWPRYYLAEVFEVGETRAVLANYLHARWCAGVRFGAIQLQPHRSASHTVHPHPTPT